MTRGNRPPRTSPRKIKKPRKAGSEDGPAAEEVDAPDGNWSSPEQPVLKRRKTTRGSVVHGLVVHDDDDDDNGSRPEANEPMASETGAKGPPLNDDESATSYMSLQVLGERVDTLDKHIQTLIQGVHALDEKMELSISLLDNKDTTNKSEIDAEIGLTHQQVSVSFGQITRCPTILTALPVVFVLR